MWNEFIISYLILEDGSMRFAKIVKISGCAELMAAFPISVPWLSPLASCGMLFGYVVVCKISICKSAEMAVY